MLLKKPQRQKIAPVTSIAAIVTPIRWEEKYVLGIKGNVRRLKGKTNSQQVVALSKINK
jgi:hypothetical protein